MSTLLGETDDAALLARVRRGNTDAMAELWTRHYPAALAAARRISRQPKDAEEVASDAFAAMLQALHNDAGPSTAVRAYLMTAVRNQAANRARRASAGDVITDEIAQFEDTDRAAADPVAHHAELGLVREAFASLPRRWQTVLWRTAVDHDSNTAIAADLKMSPNALAALARRARLGFRTAYLQAHVSTHPVAPECAPYAGRLAELVSATGRKLAAVEDTRHHVSECDSCTRRLADLEAVDRGLGALLLPALLALGPGIKWVTAATAAHTTSHVAGVLWLKGLVKPGRSRQLAIGGAAAAVAMAGIGAAYAFTQSGATPPHRVAASSTKHAPGSAAAAPGSTSVAKAPSPTHPPVKARTTVKVTSSRATTSAAAVVSATRSTTPPASSQPAPMSTPPTSSPAPTSTTSTSTASPTPTRPSRTAPPTGSPTTPPSRSPRPTPTGSPTSPPGCPPWLCWIWNILG